MYSYEERMRAVALYVKLGKRPHGTIRELGYASRNALKGCCLKFERQQDLPARSAPRPQKFSEAQKQAALAHYASHGRCVSWTFRALAYPGRAKLTAWVGEAFPEVRRVSSERRFLARYAKRRHQIPFRSAPRRAELRRQTRVGVFRIGFVGLFAADHLDDMGRVALSEDQIAGLGVKAADHANMAGL
ncbi:hypothetical protein ACFOHK_15240 [Falsigemmobacter intermedius]|uniref:Transposase n=1 Tax=Falsigemmobacter intermedius TaxID=1553448 RepID=A0A3S3WFP5_9RHOB|nr:hypothetical protein [Falsigemmobacter intermedius]RWY37625.1 hypothetical protein EP867_16965 [Falsigemmobacter intermedius]